MVVFLNNMDANKKSFSTSLLKAFKNWQLFALFEWRINWVTRKRRGNNTMTTQHMTVVKLPYNQPTVDSRPPCFSIIWHQLGTLCVMTRVVSLLCFVIWFPCLCIVSCCVFYVLFFHALMCSLSSPGCFPMFLPKAPSVCYIVPFMFSHVLLPFVTTPGLLQFISVCVFSLCVPFTPCLVIVFVMSTSMLLSMFLGFWFLVFRCLIWTLIFFFVLCPAF